MDAALLTRARELLLDISLGLALALADAVPDEALASLNSPKAGPRWAP
ncbi:hypothetical protein OG223_03490 [Streptomyces sp. NBC_01478]|nr:hypothetical protein [Streptomyces sp. NBC_01478]